VFAFHVTDNSAQIMIILGLKEALRNALRAKFDELQLSFFGKRSYNRYSQPWICLLAECRTWNKSQALRRLLHCSQMSILLQMFASWSFYWLMLWTRSATQFWHVVGFNPIIVEALQLLADNLAWILTCSYGILNRLQTLDVKGIFF